VCVGVSLSAQDEAGFAPGGVSPAAILGGGVVGRGGSRRGGGLWCLLGLILLALAVLLGALFILFLAVFILSLSSLLLPDQCSSRVVDGGQLRLRVLGEEQRLLDSSQRGRGLPAQRPCWCTRGWVVPPMGVGVIGSGKDVGLHLVPTLGGLVV